MTRLLTSGSVVYDQLLIVDPVGSQDRVTGVTVSDLVLKLFVNNAVISWDLEDGTMVLDSAISPGKIYFNEISGNNGYYSVRFFTDKIGYWYSSYVYSPNNLEIIREYDVVPRNFFGTSSSGIVASFT